jgi:hypothetical protein
MASEAESLVVSVGGGGGAWAFRFTRCSRFSRFSARRFSGVMMSCCCSSGSSSEDDFVSAAKETEFRAFFSFGFCLSSEVLSRAIFDFAGLRVSGISPVPFSNRCFFTATFSLRSDLARFLLELGTVDTPFAVSSSISDSFDIGAYNIEVESAVIESWKGILFEIWMKSNFVKK